MKPIARSGSILIYTIDNGSERMLPPNKKAVFFDFGDTLASTVPSYPLRLAAALRTLGFMAGEEEFLRAYVYTDYEVFLQYKSAGAITNREYIVWFFRKLLRKLGADGNYRAIYDSMREAMRRVEFERKTLPGAVDLLEILKRRGFVLAVISNNDGRTGEKCDEIGIARYFDLIVDSAQVGFTKPDRRIYGHALSELGLEPQEAVHVGDLWGADILGGLDAGLDVIWLNQRPVERPDDTEAPLITSLHELKDLLGV